MVLTGVAWAVSRAAGVCLCSYTDEVANFDVSFGFGSDSDGDTYNFVTDDTGEVSWALLQSAIKCYKYCI